MIILNPSQYDQFPLQAFDTASATAYCYNDRANPPMMTIHFGNSEQCYVGEFATAMWEELTLRGLTDMLASQREALKAGLPKEIVALLSNAAQMVETLQQFYAAPDAEDDTEEDAEEDAEEDDKPFFRLQTMKPLNMSAAAMLK